MSDDDITARVRQGDRQALADAFARHRGRLEAAVALRLDPHLRARIDPADVLQEAWLDIAKRFDEWLKSSNPMPLFVWMRFLTVQKLLELHRRNGAKQRDARREVPLHAGPEASTASVAERLAGSFSSPSQGLHRQEVLARVQAALDDLEEIDREVLVLRHFEELSNNEVAEILGITKAGASNRYVRALKRLREALEARPA